MIQKLVLTNPVYSVAVKEMAIKTGLGQGAEKVKGDVFATITDTRGTTCKTSFLRNNIGGDRNGPGKLDLYMNENTLGNCFKVGFDSIKILAQFFLPSDETSSRNSDDAHPFCDGRQH